MLFPRLPGALRMQGGNESVLAAAHVERVGIGLARMAEVEVGGNRHLSSLMPAGLLFLTSHRGRLFPSATSPRQRVRYIVQADGNPLTGVLIKTLRAT